MNKYQIAGKELIKGNLGNAYQAIVAKESSELIQPGRYRNGKFFFGVNGADKAFVWGNYNSSLTAYQNCPVVSAIINRKAQCAVNGQTVILDETLQASDKPQAKLLKKLLKRPNHLQTGKQFKAQNKVYLQIYGYCPVLVIKPVGFEDDYSKWKLWNIPPWMIQVEDNTELFTNGSKPFKRIFLTYMGYSVSLNPDNVFFIKENQISSSTFMSNSSAENVSIYLPDSKLYVVRENVTNITSSLNSRGSMIVNRGPQWLLTNDSNDSGDAGLFPIDSDAKKELHEDFLQYGIMSGQRKAIITDAKLKLQTVGFDAGQLKLLEGEVQDAKVICDQLNYPPELMGLIDSKYDNQDVAERALYANAIIPDAESEDEQWAELFQLEKFGLILKTDFSHVPALQENLAEKGKARLFMNQALLIEWFQNQITWNEWRKALGESTKDGMDKYYYELLKEDYVFGVVPNMAVSITNNGEQSKS
ncbi:MAG: phage portal protein [Bacteroidota bacterium]